MRTFRCLAALLLCAGFLRQRPMRLAAEPEPAQNAAVPDLPDARTPPLVEDHSPWAGLGPGFPLWRGNQDTITELKGEDRIKVERGNDLPPLPQRSPLPRGWDGWDRLFKPVSEGLMTPLNSRDPIMLVMPPAEPPPPSVDPPDEDSPIELARGASPDAPVNWE